MAAGEEPMFVEAVERARDAVCSVAAVRPEPGREHRFQILGSAWCAGTPTTFVTASHVVNPRAPADRLYLLHRSDAASLFADIWPVAEVAFDDVELNVAVLRVPASTVEAPIPVVLDVVPDGERVLTIGCPSRRVFNRYVAPDGELVRVESLLAPFANEGIVSAHYLARGDDGRDLGRCYEFNVAWLSGESGGVVLRPEPFGGFAVMQSFRPVHTPLGQVPGPRYGYALAGVAAELHALGMLSKSG
jgi:hypothetical protein